MPSPLAPPHCHSLHLPLQFSHSRGPVSKHKRTLLSPPIRLIITPWGCSPSNTLGASLQSCCIPSAPKPPPAWERADLRIYILQLHPPYHKAPVPPSPTGDLYTPSIQSRPHSTGATGTHTAALAPSSSLLVREPTPQCRYLTPRFSDGDSRI